MRTIIQLNHGENYRNLSLPCTEQELQIFCDSLGIPNDAVAQVHADHSHNNPQVEDLLAGKEVRLDELNFLMKRLDSFDEGEMNTFYATARGQKLSSLKDMINLTFNTHCYSLVDDFSDLDRLGKNLYLNLMGSVPTKEFKEFDGNAYVEKIMAENPQPLVTPYGLIYENGNLPQHTVLQLQLTGGCEVEPKIIREKTVCFTGHRSEKLPKGEALEKLRQRLENEIERAIQDGYDTFLFGGAYGFDLMAAEEVIKKKSMIDLQNPRRIRLWAIIPFEEQAVRFSVVYHERYYEIMPKCDEVITLNTRYSSQC